jgi:hypothetical protein
MIRECMRQFYNTAEILLVTGWHECIIVLVDCIKITLHRNKWGMVKIAMTSHLIFTTKGTVFNGQPSYNVHWTHVYTAEVLC